MGENSVAQVFLGIVVCAAWLCLLIEKKPYVAKWDNIIAIVLAAHLLLTLVSGQALKLYELTPGQDAYERAGFGVVMLTVSVVCVFVGLGSVFLGTPWLRDWVVLKLSARQSRRTKIAPVVTEVPTLAELQGTRLQFGADSDEYKALVKANNMFFWSAMCTSSRFESFKTPSKRKYCENYNHNYTIFRLNRSIIMHK